MSKFEIYRGNDSGEQCYRWRLIDNNNEPIAKSEEPFLKTSIVKSIRGMQERVNARIPIYHDESIDDTNKGYRFEYYQSEKDRQWYWRLKAGNHEIMAIGGEGFVSERNVRRSIENVREEIPRATITWEDPNDDPANKAKNEDQTEGKGYPGS